ncbi:uncharacterized protein DUF4209 [Jatrophihabitans sp. GAS493]|uniref:DUF4209 domain-containing protein n=1 Tax=Jatrophihabitans sp. GAS493 TaxID=1907575 RepID=UPI000BB963C5|nr:DUF4209 domain-containing protein [Jatrophihabitans sp. GAS493]SOD73276.1 uncharacterized protein DUF4209 [Jatrophihabitans sp. GAS493]
MDLQLEDIDPSWWALDAVEASADGYEPPELLSIALESLAKRDGVGEFQEVVLDTLAQATSAMLNPSDWLHPFNPAMQLADRRSIIPQDLSSEQVALLARIAPLLDRPDLLARVADIAWFYGDRSDVDLLDTAINAYRAAPLAADVWFSVGKDAWRRAMELAKRRGSPGTKVLGEMTAALKDRVLKGSASDRFLIPDLASLMRKAASVLPAERSEVADALLKLSGDTRAEPRLSRHLLREAAEWLGDKQAVWVVTERVARTYLAEADARVAADPIGGAMVEGLDLEKAIAVFVGLPRSYRQANGIDDLIGGLRKRLQGSREITLENMETIRGGSVDLTEMTAYARERVSGQSDRLIALAMFATLVPLVDAAQIRAGAEEALQGTIGQLFPSATFSYDGRKVASTQGRSESSNPAIEREVVRLVTAHALMKAHGAIAPARELLTALHRYDREFITALCVDSPTVPEGHGDLWGAGLAFGLSGDVGSAVAILVPQLEHSVRTLLKRRDVHTLFVDDQGVESEKSLNALLEMQEAEDVFGTGFVIELRSLLVVQGGFNLRNEIAHGLVDDAAAWSYQSLYVWWLCLRLALLPIAQYVNSPAYEQDRDAATENSIRPGSDRSSAGERD